LAPTPGFFAEAQAATARNQQGLLAELLEHEDDPMYWHEHAPSPLPLPSPSPVPSGNTTPQPPEPQPQPTPDEQQCDGVCIPLHARHDPHQPGRVCVRVAHSSTRDGAGSVRTPRSHCRPCPVCLHSSLPPPLPPPHSLVCPKLQLAPTTPQRARQTHRDNMANSQRDNVTNTTRQHMVNTCSEHDMITHPAGARHCLGSSCLCIGRLARAGNAMVT
jgi:hypothetical protein